MINRKQIAIIGGGAAGLMCAASILEHHPDMEVQLFERNPYLGAKVIISGGGRCNVTTGITDRKILLSKYTRGASFLKYTLAQFPPEKVMAWFENRGVRLKVEGDQRVFPVSDNGRDVVGAFEKLFQNDKVTVHLNESVKSILPTGKNGFKLLSNKRENEFDAVVITTGGNAYSHTGSTGDGYSFAAACGHKITPLGPSLNSFLTAEEWPKKLSGVSLQNCQLEGLGADGEKKQIEGPLLFTHFGISGPATFALSSHLAFTPISKDSQLKIKLIPIADRGFEQWDKLIREMLEENGARQIHNVLGHFLPQRFADTIVEMAGLQLEKKAAEVSKSGRKEIIRLLTGGLELTLVQRRPGDEFVTAGGVSLEEVDSKTMRSKLNPRLYFAGEVLDVDGLTGGFNLQASWATGWLAGKNMEK